MPMSLTIRGCYSRKRSGKLAAIVLLLHDNAPMHKSRVSQVAIREHKFEQLNHLAWNEISGQ